MPFGYLSFSTHNEYAAVDELKLCVLVFMHVQLIVYCYSNDDDDRNNNKMLRYHREACATLCIS